MAYLQGFGRRLTGVVVRMAGTLVKGFIKYDLGRNATIVFIVVGLRRRGLRADVGQAG